MKHVVRLVGLTALLSALVMQAQTPASKPGSEHQKMNLWLGDWTYEGQSFATPLGLAGKFSGRSSVRPILNGFFVEFRGEDNGPAGPEQWYEVDGYDAAKKKYTWCGFGSNGKTDMVTYTIDGNKVTYAGTQLVGGKEYRIRGSCAFSADFASFREKREVSEDGQKWMPIFESKVTRIRKSPQMIEAAR